jgi:hypothetical protein
MKAMFRRVGVEPDGRAEGSAQLRIPVCPFGSTSELTALAPAGGLAANASFTLEREREPIIGIRCSFNDNVAATSADGTAAPTASFLQYQVSRIPGDDLPGYLTQLESENYERIEQHAFGGVIYTDCSEPQATAAGADHADCGAIWMTGVIAVGMRFTGPQGARVDTAQSLVDMVPSIITILSTADPAEVGAQQIATTSTT